MTVPQKSTEPFDSKYLLLFIPRPVISLIDNLERAKHKNPRPVNIRNTAKVNALFLYAVITEKISKAIINRHITNKQMPIIFSSVRDAGS